MVAGHSSPCGIAWKNWEIFHRRRDDDLIIWTARELENRYSNELTDDLGINSDCMPANSGLKHQSAVIVLHHL
jgi:hypothetical protein